MAADWQTVSKRLYTPEGKREGGQAHSLNMLLHLFVLSMCVCVCANRCIVLLFVFFFPLTCLSVCYVSVANPTMVADNGDAVREAVSTEVKSYGCQW